MREVMIPDLEWSMRGQAEAYAMMDEAQRDRFLAAIAKEKQTSETGLNSHAYPRGPRVTSEAYRAEQDQWATKQLTSEERAACIGWSGSDYHEMRALDSGREFDSYFRRNGKLNIERIIAVREKLAEMRSAFAKAPRYSGVLYRGVRIADGEAIMQAHLKVGNEIVQEAMSSWSESRSVAHGFGPQIFKIHSTKGVAINHQKTSMFANRESEVMIDKGQRYKVVKVTKTRDGHLIELVELDD